MSKEHLEEIISIFIDHFNKNRYQYTRDDHQQQVRLNVSNLKDRCHVTIYQTGSTNIQGKESALK